MATITQAAQSQGQPRTQSGYPEGSLRFDWAAILLACIFIAGLWLDGWAHFHGRTDNTFFTPWHFLFYSAFGMTAAFVGYNQWRNQGKGYAFQKALPKGYWLSLVGVTVFAVGGVGDMIWHILFGIEGGSEALTSPTHLMLGMGMALVFTGPLRAAWIRSKENKLGGWRMLGPALISATLLLALLAFFTSYANPLVNPLAFGSGSAVTQTVVDQIYVMNADGGMQTRISSDAALASSQADWSPDGKHIVYVSGDVTSDQTETDLYIMDADGTHPVQLTSTKGQEASPDWSPDGKHIAYLGSVDSHFSIFVISADGGEPTRITNDDTDYLQPVWSPDSQYIATAALNGNQGNIVIMKADGSDPKAITTDGDSYAAIWSPDGSKIVFTRRGSGDFDIYLANSDGSNATQLTTDPEFDLPRAFSPDGTQIYFTSERTRPVQLFVMPVSGEGENGKYAHNVSNNAGLQINRAVMSSDGSKILFGASVPSSGNGGNVSPQDFGVASILLQAILVAAFIVVLMWKWSLPFGALTFTLTVTSFLLTLLTDLFFLVPAALIAGLIADILIWRLKPSAQNQGNFHRLAFLIPVIFYALYFLTIQLIGGIGWHIHVWGGAIFLSGMIGLLLSYMISETAPAERLAERVAAG